ncbi:MAG TPA: metalloregulator ArsR/SmtB family transcription factor [Saprospiraceae bacterium]|nr:metalloregulator ArsR/SmtB family transcription factor [Saprospiraceae bacterium]
MEKRLFKDAIYSGIAGMTKAFSHANRLEILDLLANGEKTVEQIAAQTSVSVANASQHLQILKNARLVSARRQGTFIYYALSGKKAYAAWKALRNLALDLEPEVQRTMDQYRSESNSLPGCRYAELPDPLSIIFLDVRPREEFISGHLENALSIPMQELEERISELPRHKTIITYCRGPFCTFADEAVAMLKAKGYEALRLEESYLDIKLNETQWNN